MLSGGNAASVRVSRKGPLRLFQVGTLRPSLSLPSPVSTTIRRVGVSTTSEWIDILSRPSSVAKGGKGQGDLRISSLLASGRMKRVLPVVSSSTIFVILTLPTFQIIRRFPMCWFCWGERCWFPCPRAMDHLARLRVDAACQSRERRNARTSRLGRKGRVSDRDNARIRRQGGGVGRGLRLER